ncbi:hypothetical protein [Paenibacillus xylanexedens]|uniref:hypothetical protein n=1 Tax=Paenibacillus xylanexedens TaxID=528191 RepID=UPI0016432EEB|nr:hypothetical protein [Paenibacillus xylanexedens]
MFDGVRIRDEEIVEGLDEMDEEDRVEEGVVSGFVDSLWRKKVDLGRGLWSWGLR